ncbi:hypothetical protein ABW20_dc0104420 [Dactylellina cionopaga]|nr:hypothetical protein ABW20_dc0104420 [Dactylellina cionopaga]
MHNTGGSRSTVSHFHTAPSTPAPPETTNSQYLQVQSSSSPRPVSVSSISSLNDGSSSSPRPTKGILKNRSQGQSYIESLKTRRAFTSSSVVGVSPPNNKNISSPEPSPTIVTPSEAPLLRPSSAPPPKTRYSYTSGIFHPKNLSGIPEAEGPDGIELKERPRRSTENLPSTVKTAATGAAVSSSFIIPHPTRTPPPIPFLQPSSPVPTPESQNASATSPLQNNGFINSKPSKET